MAIHNLTANSDNPFLEFTVVNLSHHPRMISFLKHPVRLDAWGAGDFFYHTFHVSDIEPRRKNDTDAQLHALVDRGCVVLVYVDLGSAVPT
jgi:hypothetical protein